MNILENTHYVSIPKTEYDNMKREIESKKDIIVQFSITLTERSFAHKYGMPSEVIVTSISHELNTTKISSDLINNTAFYIQTACNAVNKRRQDEIDKLYIELINIKKRWWYKFFSLFNNSLD